MAFNVHKPRHYTDNERVVEAVWLPTQTAVPSNATNETLGLNDLLQPYRKALSAPWLNDAVCLHFVVTLAQFLFRRRRER